MTHLMFEAPAPLLSLNDRLHWTAKAPTVALWRQAAWAAGVNSGRRGLRPSNVLVHLPVKGARRRDPHNYIATWEARALAEERP